MLPFGVTIPAAVPQRSEIPEGLKNYPVLCLEHKNKSKESSLYICLRVQLSIQLNFNGKYIYTGLINLMPCRMEEKFITNTYALIK
jgi:hypothetical protein